MMSEGEFVVSMSMHDNLMIMFLILMLQELAELTERFRTVAAMVGKFWDGYGWTPVPIIGRRQQTNIISQEFSHALLTRRELVDLVSRILQIRTSRTTSTLEMLDGAGRRSKSHLATNNARNVPRTTVVVLHDLPTTRAAVVDLHRHVHVQFIVWIRRKLLETLKRRHSTRGLRSRSPPVVADTILTARTAVAFPPLTLTEFLGGAEHSTTHALATHSCLKS
jgi:hypothetical protein